MDGSSYSPDNVVAYDDGSWVVHLRLQIFEEVGGIQAKQINVHYPLRVVKMNISPNQNFWGLALDGYPVGQHEQLLDEESDEESGSDT